MKPQRRNDESFPGKRLAIVGGGSSGLISTATALNTLQGWEVVCFERSDSIQGCWGNPYPDFVSTSTRYTTQFACFPVCGATVNPDGGASREEFFRNGEYGEYLEKFADHFNLRNYIKLERNVETVSRQQDGTWLLEFDKGQVGEVFDCVILCTGLTARPKPLECDVQQLTAADLNQRGSLEKITGKTVVVLGGGESAVDYADRLAMPELENKVYLSLSNGVRVSPRYHPVRGVPSDFLRNRLMLTVHPDIRNRLGQVFVRLRIKYERLFRKLFKRRSVGDQLRDRKEVTARNASQESKSAERRRYWTMQLTLHAKDDLFNMFHNKSDDFLQAVGDGRIQIVGPPEDRSFNSFSEFGADANKPVTVEPDLVVPAIGYRSNIAGMTVPAVEPSDFYLGCCHTDFSNLFLVGFARPVIGNIPTISEMQARFVCSMISGEIERPSDIKARNKADRRMQQQQQFAKINPRTTYPVEMFPYCDRLAREMGRWPQRNFPGLRKWRKTMLAPATTLHYFENEIEQARSLTAEAEVFMPPTLVAFILFMKPLDWAYKLLRRIAGIR